MKKVVWTLNVDNYAPELTALTYPYLKRYAYKIGAEFKIISERKYPEYPPVYEKVQIYDLGRANDWNIYIDSDALVHPDMYDVTDHLNKNTVCHNGSDMAGNRWRYDRFFRRDGRHIGSCNWFTVASDWCIDLWTPLTDLTLEEALANIFPVQNEVNSGFTAASHLIDDYVLSRNIAKFGLKFDSFHNMKARMSDKGDYLWHVYNVSVEQKLVDMKEVMTKWKL